MRRNFVLMSPIRRFFVEVAYYTDFLLDEIPCLSTTTKFWLYFFPKIPRGLAGK